jgi:hypothetical protein
VQIPDFKNRTADRALDPVSSLKPLPALAAVSLRSSFHLLWFYRGAYSLFALALLLVFYPFILKHIAGLVVLALLWWGLWWSYRYSLKHEPVGALRFSEGSWIYQRADGETLPGLQLAGPVVCWSWVIILPLRDSETGETYRLPVFNDALTASDNASLRRWLQACLIPKS